MLNFAVSIETNLHFIANAVNVNMNYCWSFECKGSFEVRKHEAKIDFFSADEASG